MSGFELSKTGFGKQSDEEPGKLQVSILT